MNAYIVRNLLIFNVLCIALGYAFQTPVGELMTHWYWWTVFIIFVIFWGILGLMAEKIFPDSGFQRLFFAHLNGESAKNQASWFGVASFFVLGYGWAVANAVFFGSSGSAPLFETPKELWAGYKGEEFIELPQYRLDTNNVNYMFLRREDSDDKENGAYIYYRLEVADSQQIYPVWFMGDYETDNITRQRSDIYPEDAKILRATWASTPKNVQFFRATRYEPRYTRLVQQQNLMNEAAGTLRERIFPSVPSSEQCIFLFPIGFDPNTWRTVSKFALLAWIVFANVMYWSMLRTKRL